jgi:uncharacterized membrane protein
LIAGIPLIIVLPGLLFISVLWPPKSGLEPVHRIALIIPTSVAIVGILLLVVNYFFSYNFEIVVLVLASLEIVLSVIASIRTPISSSPTEVFSRYRKFVTTLTSQDLKIGHLFLGISILVFGISIAYTALTPRQSRDITELFLVEPGRIIDKQSIMVKQGDPFNLTVAVRNLESMHHEYQIEVWGVRQFGEKQDPILHIERFILEKNETKQSSLPLIMNSAGANKGVEILLYIDNEPGPYRRIYISIDVEM